MSKFYITTPIYYVNDLPHIGHAYTTIAADIIARYRRMRGEDVFFLVGTDENAQKNVESVKVKGKDVRSAVQKYVDQMSAQWQSTWDCLSITNDDFIRTTEDRHVKYVKEFWEKVKAKGDIYKDTYEGLYCTGCESYKTESDLVDGKCPDHKRKPEKLKEENYFFKLSKYRDPLLRHIKQHPEFVQPESRRNEIVAYIKDHAQDFSISRENLEWGIPVPGDESQTIYVWFDALLNYLSAGHKKWPANVQLVGKDIIKFHCAYWPAMLMSAGLPLPKTVFAHGFFTVDGQKMSKTLKNVVDPLEVIKEYSNDVLRYYLFREISFGGDGDFSHARLKKRYQAELANGIGNLVSRVLSMIEKYSDGKIPAQAPPRHVMEDLWAKYEETMQDYALDKVLDLVAHCIGELDAYIDREKPWDLAKSGNDRLFDVLYILAETLRYLAWALLPFMPETAEKIFKQLGLKDELKKPLGKAQKWGGLKKGTKINKGEVLFPRLEQ